MNETWIALIGTLFGGAGFKIIEWFLTRRRSREDDATKLRGELRGDLSALRHEADRYREDSEELREEIDKWRSKYYALVASIARGRYDEAQNQITERKED